MHVHTGTSGFSYDEWHGRFYPVGLPADERLRHYSGRLSSVEINNSFYQMPKAALLTRWRQAVPDEFRFALKAPRRITHSQQLQQSKESLEYFLKAASALGDTLGPVLFQLPPFLRKDAPRLSEFLPLLPPTLRAAFEFRHASWFDDEIFSLLSGHNAALCCGDAEKSERSPPLVATADFGYLRLRAPSYTEQDLHTWSGLILGQRWTEAYVYLKHEVLGPDYAAFLAAVASGALEPAFPSEVQPPAQLPSPPAHPRKGLARTKPSKQAAEAAKVREPTRRRRAQ